MKHTSTLLILSALALLPASSNAALLAYYSFDSDFTDSSANSNDLTVATGTPTITSTAGEYVFGGGALDADSTLDTEEYLNLTAYVPPSAKGFRVETPSVYVTDLGTRFGMAVHERGVTDIHSFKGCVATSFENPRQNVQDRIKTLYTNDTVCFDAEADKVENIETDLQQFALSWNDVLYRPRTSGPVQYERKPMSTFLQDGAEMNRNT